MERDIIFVTQHVWLLRSNPNKQGLPVLPHQHVWLLMLAPEKRCLPMLPHEWHQPEVAEV